MKKTKQTSAASKNDKKPSSTAGQSVVTTIGDRDERRAEIIKELTKKVSKKLEGGGNSVVNDFLKVADRVLALYPSFSFQEFIQVGKSLDFQDFKELERLYEVFTTHLVFAGVLSQEPSIYDEGFIFLQVRA